MNQKIHNQFDLTDKVAIVTGASKGIGAAIAKGLAEFGAKVVVSSRKQEAVDEVADEIKATGGMATGIACHVGDEAQRSQLVEKTVATYGRIDILINNAAINPVYGPLAEVTGEVFDKIMDVNVKACMLLTNLCYPHLKKQGGSVVNISSVEGLKPGFGLGVYSVSKAALIMLTQNQAREWGGDGIRSNVICPGLVQTKFSAALWNNEKMLGQYERHIPAGRMAQPDEMVGLALFLASDAASYSTGGVFTADGGYVIS
ncbi:SDR family NAD(P)-dependent oxidoreductase [Flavilitoribacter nigricans]|uniref:Short-chain dehydrogenase n=1 Tax=Flavilitoribacter nigricans (strain ATCC 23147 / DSM 23189 / NBRC 102662 / NCIMB 1420 / SS-2) TaxID=1122177 RepID=A0A2D0NIL5_FLAN2|nr:glucose 1-dehydrogenase [Flavilitoribacter nigricans]PHN08230.1 short-chain dehydrogenase [Flavilitoribacter nigricans DSM 23189 = NBRC 102662]